MTANASLRETEYHALEAALRMLQAKGATRHCVRMVFRRASELSPDREKDLEYATRFAAVPGFRPGKATRERILAAAAKDPVLDRWLFRCLIRCWMELHTGFPETMADSARRARPQVDFRKAEWAAIVETVPAVLDRSSRNPEEDVLLGLFAYRFDEAIGQPHGPGCTCEQHEPRAPSDVSLSQAVPEGATVEASALNEDALPTTPSSGTVGNSSTRERNDGPGSLELPHLLVSALSDLEATPSTSTLWDDAVPRFLEQVSNLRAAKLVSRAAQSSRLALVAALTHLRSQSVVDELEFLQARPQTEGWTCDGVSDGEADELAQQVRDLAEHVEAHRSARANVRNASSDADLETWTMRRQEAKAGVLTLISKIGQRIRTDLGPSSLANLVQPATSISPPTESPLPDPPKGSQGGDALADSTAGEPRQPADALGASPAPPPSDPPPAQRSSSGPTSIEASPLAGPSSDLRTATSLPPELGAFHAFSQRYWTDHGRVMVAPWESPDFTSAVSSRLREALERGPSRAWEGLIAARALESLGVAPRLSEKNIRASAAIWAAPLSESAGADQDRCGRLRARAEENSSQRVALVLESLRPSLDHLHQHEISPIIEAADFESGALRVVVERFLSLRAQGHDPVALARQASVAVPARQPASSGTILDARRELLNLVTRMWSAAGGKIQRTHCRRAWSEFIEGIQPFLVRLYPPPRGDDRWTVAEALRETGTYSVALEALCEKYEALFDDRRRMLRAAGEIEDAARRVVMLRHEELAGGKGAKVPLPLPEVELGQLRTHHLRAPEEEFARALLLQVLDVAASPSAIHPLAIKSSDVYARPNLLRVFKELPKEASETLKNADSVLGYADDLGDPVRAAAILNQPAKNDDGANFDAFVADLEKSQSYSVLSLIARSLDERLQRKVHAERSGALGQLAQALSLISQDVEDLSQLGNRFTPSVKEIRDGARLLIEQGDVTLDATLTKAWLDRVHETAVRMVAEHVANLEREAAARDDEAEIRLALNQGHYGRAIRLLRGHEGTELRAARQTEWREDAEANRAVLQQALDSSPDAKLKALVGAWRIGVKADAVRADRTLRTEFVRLITDGRDLGRESAPAFIALPIASITGELTRAQLMPTWMPQLSRFARLLVLTPPVSPEQPSFRQATVTRAAEFPQDLVVFLAPRLSAVRREEVLTEIRRRGITAAVVDDLDLLRLLNPGGQRPHLLLGLLEVILEQQRRAAFSPFDLPEGSNVRLEMYVGRQDQARELARTANYSRLFSGRKLGKSALLRFVERTEGGTTLPSGNVLRVVYVPAVGIESEGVMAETILASLESALSTRFERRADGEPADKLGMPLTAYLGTHRTESLLVVLDEADVFVERQLSEYEERRERCLSFQMRSRFSALTDEAGLPRVRFVFAGYRVTNRSQGAWSNWGRVLFLDPLEPEDAARLISAPLAVMGIDVGAHAHEIAYRCGYQPAILLRFGERLMEQLETPTRSGRQIVSQSELSKVFDDPRVHEEIRTITRNNFEGHPIGLVVFGALLREFLEASPGQPVREASQRILERLRELEPDTSWLERDGDGSATIRSLLADFVERSLLRERQSEGETAYSLRFPHHLTILASLADGARIREEIRRLKLRTESRNELAERGLVSQRVLRDLGDATQPRSGAIAVVGTLWSQGTYDKSGGIPDRIGITGDETVDASAILEGRKALSGVRAIRRVDIASAERLMEEIQAAEAQPLLMGGLDLLRWALGMRRTSRTLLFEVHGVERASVHRVAWWFQRVRGLEFIGTDAIERIHARTGGMPLLLDVVDRQLQSAHGTTVADARVDLALAAIDEAIPRVARDLCDGAPTFRLAPREREILQMIECVVRAEASAGLDLGSALTELWELFCDRCGFPPLASDDSTSLDVLLEAGLLPAKPYSELSEPISRLGTIKQNDPLFEIVRAFPAR